MTVKTEVGEPYWGFIYSTRFWALVIGAVVFYVHSKNLIGQEEMLLIETILGGFGLIRTVDRAAEKVGGE